MAADVKGFVCGAVVVALWLGGAPMASAQTADSLASLVPGIGPLPMVTSTKRHKPGDPINVGLVGSKDEIIALFNAAGWQQAVPVTFKSSAAIAGSVVLRRAYLTAPVSALLYQGHMQDLAFEKEVGRSASKRHHVRFWKVADAGPDGRPLWLGAATFDKGVGFSHRTGGVTHHINGDVDAERNFLIDELGTTARVAQVMTVLGLGPTQRAKNGGGDIYWTDGNVRVAVIAAGPAQ